MKPVWRTILPWLILLFSFAVPALFYNSIPSEVLIVRSFFSDEATFAPKNLFTVFRVPLIELVCAAAFEIMRRKTENVDADYHSMWFILLYTVAAKSLLQAFEIIAPRSYADTFFYLTLAVVLVGISAAIFKGRRFFREFFGGKLKFTLTEKAIFAIILVAYLGLAIVPILVFK